MRGTVGRKLEGAGNPVAKGESMKSVHVPGGSRPEWVDRIKFLILLSILLLMLVVSVIQNFGTKQ